MSIQFNQRIVMNQKKYLTKERQSNFCIMFSIRRKHVRSEAPCVGCCEQNTECKGVMATASPRSALLDNPLVDPRCRGLHALELGIVIQVDVIQPEIIAPAKWQAPLAI